MAYDFDNNDYLGDVHRVVRVVSVSPSGEFVHVAEYPDLHALCEGWWDDVKGYLNVNDRVELRDRESDELIGDSTIAAVINERHWRMVGTPEPHYVPREHLRAIAEDTKSKRKGKTETTRSE